MIKNQENQYTYAVYVIMILVLVPGYMQSMRYPIRVLAEYH